MVGGVFVLFVSVVLPVTVFLYACWKRSYVAFLLGTGTFVVSQMILRMPLLSALERHSTSYLFFTATQPILYPLFLGVTAALFEELARYLVMRFFMKRKNWRNGLIFGLGHGGIEAILLVGVPILYTMFTTPYVLTNGLTFISGMERLSAILLHVGFSILVLQGVVKKQFRYVWIAIVLHTIVNASIGIISYFIPSSISLFIIEGIIVMMGLIMLAYSLVVRKKGLLR